MILTRHPSGTVGSISLRIPPRGRLRRLAAVYSRAANARRRGDLAGALQGYKRVMEALSDQLNDAARFWLGPNTTVEDINLERLIDVIRRAIRMPQPQSAEEKVLWGLMTGVFADASSTARQLSIARSQGRDPVIAAGVIQSAACAILVNPWHPTAPHNLGRFLDYIGDLDSAQAFLSAAVVLDESQCECWRYLGEFLGRRGDRAAMEECRDKAARCRMRTSDDRFNMSLNYLSRGEYATGWRLYESRRECPEMIYLYGRADLPWPRWDPAVGAAA